ncbi:MAG TPA: EAL domain-containing protein [Gammaproteobacteria bacterium]|nr:EAL domain-containing protein [Gammaproteobacteria bacterium]
MKGTLIRIIAIVLASIGLCAVIGWYAHSHSLTLALAMLMIIIFGMSILLGLLVPFIRRLIHSEKNLLNANLLLKESENKLRVACDNATLSMGLILQNINVVKRAEEQLRHLAYHDSLTGLFNRNHLEQRMREILKNSLRHKHGFALIFLDLDHFKNVNDTIGHDAGDLLLQIVGQRLKNNIRTSDVVSRIGGDEFVLIFNELNEVEKISNIVQKILAHLMQPITLKGHEIYVTTSLGISVYPYDGRDVQTLMKNADLALYRAKELGRNNYQFCTLEMTTKAQQKMSRQNALVQAMAKNEFVLFFQPKLNLHDQSISGVEALLRWPNPAYSNIPTMEIIHLAEDTGLIIALNEWVFKTACIQVKKWRQEGFSLTLSVNLSGRQFKQSNFIENLTRMLNETEFPPECLELEITEGLIIQDPEYIFHTLQLLKKKNISIAIDDFGTGYSSLDYLRRFSIDKIKIDRKFIQTLTIDSASTVVVSAIIAMSNKLGIQTVAEGVETKTQYEFLLKEKCTEIQGYYVCPPKDFYTISQFLKNPVIQY